MAGLADLIQQLGTGAQTERDAYGKELVFRSSAEQKMAEAQLARQRLADGAIIRARDAARQAADPNYQSDFALLNALGDSNAQHITGMQGDRQRQDLIGRASDPSLTGGARNSLLAALDAKPVALNSEHFVDQYGFNGAPTVSLQDNSVIGLNSAKVGAEHAQAGNLNAERDLRARSLSDVIDAANAFKAGDAPLANQSLALADVHPIAEGTVGRPLPIPAEVAGRMAMGESYMSQVPDLIGAIKEGKTSGLAGSIAVATNVGDAGLVVNRQESGVDALIRSLTGAGMPLAEAEKYARRYSILASDSKDRQLEKVGQLSYELSNIDKTIRSTRNQPAGTAYAGVVPPPNISSAKVGGSPYAEGTRLKGPGGAPYIVHNGQPVPL